MPTPHDVEVAARIGMLAHRVGVPGALEEALRLLADAVRGDATSVVAVEPFGGRFLALGALGYPEAVSEALAGTFTRTPWMTQVLETPLPPSISTEEGQSFRHGWFYAERMEPAGFRDGMSAPLRGADGRCVGLVHVSSGLDGAFGTESRAVLLALTPALTAMVDARRLAVMADPHLDAADPGIAAAMVDGPREATFDGLARPEVLDDPRFRQVVDEFAACGGRRLEMYWTHDRSWFRVLLHRTPVPGSDTTVTVVRSRHSSAPLGLSPRELDVLTLVAVGLTDQAIAARLVVSERTVHSHVQHVLRKTGCSGRAGAAALAVSRGIVRPVPGPGGGADVLRRLAMA
jgi:DNA-binding CsgD family transcriptional regulator